MTHLLRNLVVGVDIGSSSQNTFPEDEEEHKPDVFDPPVDGTGQEENHVDPLKHRIKIKSPTMKK